MSTEIKKKATNINEVARRRLEITRDEYALCSYVQYRAADPRQKVSGWCCDTKDGVAEFIGVTRPGLYKMIERLEAKGLLQSGAIGSVRVTEMWIDAEQNCKLSLQNRAGKNVNLVDTDCKLSLHENVNSVYESIIINVKNDISKNEREEKTERDATPAPLAGANVSTTVEAPLDQKNNLAAGGGENAAPGAGPGANVCQAISITDSPKAHTPLELEAAMQCFYTQYANEWTSGVLQYARGAQYPVEKQKEIVKEFCCWAVEHNRGGDSYASLNARLQKWFSNEKYSTWKQSTQPSNTSTTIPALRRAGQD